MNKQLVGPAEAARRLGVSHRTLEAWRFRGGGPPFVKITFGRAGRVRYRVADLERWIDDHARANTSADRGGA